MRKMNEKELTSVAGGTAPALGVNQPIGVAMDYGTVGVQNAGDVQGGEENNNVTKSFDPAVILASLELPKSK